MSRPELRVVQGGEPTDEELAALLVVLAARRGSAEPPPAESARRPLSPWVASGLVKGTRTKA